MSPRTSEAQTPDYRTKPKSGTPRPHPTGRDGQPRFSRLVLLALGLLALLLLFSWGPEPGFSAPFERNSLGLRFSLRAKRHPEYTSQARKQIALLAIKDSTLQDPALSGQHEYTVPRNRHAQVIDNLVKAGAKVIVFDLLFDKPRPEDTALAAAARRADKAGCKVVWAAGWLDAEDGLSPDVLRPVPQLLKASPLIGHTRYPQSDYPLLDRIEPYIQFRGKSIPSLSVAAALAYERAGPEPAQDERFPDGREATFPINYFADEEPTFAAIPYEWVFHGGSMHGLSPMDYFRNKVVVVGDVTQLNHDASLTPVGDMRGAAIHAQAIATLLVGAWLHYANGLEVTISILLMLGLGIAVGGRMRSWTAFAAGAGLLILFALTNLYLFCDYGFVLPLMAPLYGGVLGVIAAVAERSWSRDGALTQLEAMVAHMYSPQIARAGIPWGKVTLVFCDIEGSGDLSRLYGRRFEPARDEYFRILRECLLRHHGFEIDNAGDSIFIAFQNATDAVLFGLEVQRIFAVHRWANGVKDLRVRIGVHTGRPIIRKDRERFTYRGTVTNLTNRVSASCQAGAVAVSEETRQAAASLEPRVVFIARETPPLKTFGDVITYEARSTEEAPPTSASTSLKSEVRRRFASMLRPETNYTAPDQEKETDQLEGARGSQYVPPVDSRSSAADAGLDDRAWFEEDTDDDSDIVDFATPREIPMTDLESRSPAGTITSAELSDLNLPGDVDIEELDEDDLEDALPPDARLDPLEP